MEDKKFSRREWFLTIALVMMTEYWFVSLSYNFVDSQQVVNFISFGAAIASILLAIVAIIHGFIQSDSSSKTSATLQNQAESIKETTVELARSSESISEHLTTVSTITSRLDDVNTNILDSIEKLKEIQDSVEDINRNNQNLINTLTQKRSETPPIKTTTNDHISFEKIIEIIFTKSSYELDLVGYALHKYSESQKTISTHDFIDEYLGAIDPQKKVDYMSAFFNIDRLLIGINAIKYNSLSDKLIITENFKAILPSIADVTKQESGKKVAEGVKALDAAFPT